MKIAIFETEEWERDGCLALSSHAELVCTPEPLNEDTTAACVDADIVSPFVNSRLAGSVLARLPNLKLIATRSTGYDHIDLDYCRAHGVTVCNVPDYGDATVAEQTFALLLAISRRLIPAVENTRHGRFTNAGLRGFDLRGRRLGVIGVGRIGRRVIEIARGFGMQVIAFDLRPDPALATRLGFRYAPFDAVLAEADVVTLHVPAVPGGRRLMSDREFGLMKTGAVLINTARGNIVDLSALIRALTSKKLQGAGLDVLPQETLLRDEAEIFRNPDAASVADMNALAASHVLMQMSNVLITPHNAFNTDDAVGRILSTTVANILGFLKGEAQNVVT